MGHPIRAKIEAIFREVFDDDQLQLSERLSSETFPAWDSLAHIRLVSALEDELSLTFTLEDIEAMTSVAKILLVVDSKG
jgi:acyl carrier protein